MFKKLRNHLRYLWTGKLYAIVTWDGSNVGVYGAYKDEDCAYELAKHLRDNWDGRYVVKEIEVKNTL